MNASLTRRYARAVFASVVQAGQVDLLVEELRAVDGLLQGQGVLRQTLDNAAFPLSERAAVLTAVLQRMNASETTRRLLQLLLQRGRMPVLPALERELQALADRHAGRLRAALVTAQPINPLTVEGTREILRSKAGKRNVLLEQKLDERS